MFDAREKGTYIYEYIKVINGVTYIKKETTMVNDKNECIQFIREYKPGIKIGLENGIWELKEN